MKISTQNIALIAVFASLFYVFSLITPFVPALGLPELQIQMEALVASVFGFVLGPYLGGLAAFLGAFISWILPPGSSSPFGAPFLLAPPINAMVIGFIFYRKWKWSFILFGVLIVAFLFLPPSQPFTNYYYVSIAVIWDKLIALMLIVPSVKFNRLFTQTKYRFLLFFLLSFIGNQADNMWGAVVFAFPVVYQSIFGLTVEEVRILFTLSPFIYPAIRLIQAILATIISVPLIKVLKRNYMDSRETINNHIDQH